MAGTTLSKSVSLRIVANAGTAKETLDDIAAKADTIDGKKSSLTVGVNTGTTKEQLDEITAKADALGIKNIKFKVTADTSQAKRALAETKAESSGLTRNLIGLTGALTGFGDIAVLASEDTSTFGKVLAGLSLATGVLEPVLAGLVVTTAALGSGMAAAGVGAGVFGLVAKAAFTTVSSNIKSATTAYEAMATASTKAQKAADMTAWKKSLSGLDAGQKELVIDTAKAESTWHTFVVNSTAGIAQTLAPALSMLPQVLNDASMFLGPVEAALQDIIINVQAALSSPFWTSTISEWAATSGPLLQDIATAIGNIIHGLAGVLTTFMPMSTGMGSAIDNLTAKFAKWGETLGSHSGFQSLMSMFKTDTPLAMTTLKNLATAIVNIGKAMTGLDGIGNSKSLLQFLTPLSGILASLSKNQDLDRIALYFLAANSAGKKLKGTLDGIKTVVSGFSGGFKNVSNLLAGFNNADKAASEATGAWGTVGGKLKNIPGALQTIATKMGILRKATRDETVAQEGMDVALEANPIGIIITLVVALAAVIVILSLKSKAFRDFWKDAWSDIKNWTGNVVAFLEGDWKAMQGSFDSLVGHIEGAWSATMGAFKAIGSNVVHDVEYLFVGLPSQIIGALSGLGGQLWSIGYNAMMGLWNGISSMVGWIVGQVENIASKISGAFSKILGILSPSRVFMSHGRNIALGLIQGMQGMTGQVEGASTNLGASVNRGFNVRTPSGSGLRSAGAGNTFNITVQGVVGDAGATGQKIVQTINTYLRQTGQAQLANA